MLSFNRRQFLQSALLGSGGTFVLSSEAWAALPPGVETKAEVYVATEERLRQPYLWVFEVWFKPLRMMWVDLPDFKTGDVSPRQVWYLCYRALNRPILHREEPKHLAVPKGDDSKDLSIFLPEFTLVTDDNNTQKIYIDQVMPVAQAAIEKREKRKYKNSVEIKGPVPPPTPYDSKVEKSIYGVATWRGVDPATDRFKIYMAGFSNGYEVKQGPDGSEIVLRKTLVQDFVRYGDEFDLGEKEFRRSGSPKWIYR